MKKMLNRILAILLASIMVFNLLPAMVYASAANFTCSDVKTATEYLRGRLKMRSNSIIFDYRIGRIDTSAVTTSFGEEILAAAQEHTGAPTEGDYIKSQFGKCSVKVSRRYENGNTIYTIVYTPTYYTTRTQENKLDTEVDKILKNLKLDNKNDYEKVESIYNYICKNVKYDYTNLNNRSYTLKYTAYAALINKTAVCNGYSLLFYRMALAAGVDTRIIIGTGKEGPHGWNIVKLDGKYYYLDATWDAESSKYSYFLKGKNNFLQNHTPDKAYTTASFEKQYPISTTDYVNSLKKAHTHTYGKVDFQWNTSGGCKVVSTCTCGNKKNIACSVTSKVTPATAKANGQITYIATAKSEGKTYTGTRTSVIYRPKTVTLSKISYTYNKKTQRPAIQIKDTANKTIAASNYQITYPKKSVNPGTYKLIIKFTGKNYKGITLTKSYMINKAAQKISASNKSKVVGDKTFSLGVKLTTGNGKLSYQSNNKKVATVNSKGKVTIKGAGKAKILITAAGTGK